jgi:hypothetical protein
MVMTFMASTPYRYEEENPEPHNLHLLTTYFILVREIFGSIPLLIRPEGILISVMPAKVAEENEELGIQYWHESSSRTQAFAGVMASAVFGCG